MMEAQRRCIYLDVLRIFAALAVICVHTSCQIFGNDNLPVASVGSSAWCAAAVYDALSRFCVPIFLMISGALFLGKALPIKRIYGKYVLRVLTAYVFWSFLYTLLRGERAFSLIFGTIRGGPRFSFLCYIIGLYMLVPLLDRFIREPRYMAYFLALCFFFGFLESQLYDMVSIEQIRYISVLYAYVHEFFTKMCLTGLTWLPAYFVLGYALFHYDMQPRHRWVLYCTGLLGTAATVWSSLRANSLIEYWLDYRSVNVLFMTVGLFVFAKYGCARFSLCPALERAISRVAELTFCAFLVHSWVLDTFLLDRGVTAYCASAWISIPVIVLLVFVISLCIAFVAKKIPVLTRYIT